MSTMNLNDILAKVTSLKTVTNKLMMILPAMQLAADGHDFEGIGGFRTRADFSKHTNNFSEGYSSFIFGCSHTDSTIHRNEC